MVRGLMMALVTTVGIPVMVLAQAPATTGHEHQAGATEAQTAPGRNPQMMQEMHQKMMADMTAMDQKLDGLVSQMNTAQGQAKVDAMAAVINEMISQRKQMEQHMSRMMGMAGQHGMMGMAGQRGMMGGEGQQGMMTGTSGGMMSGMMARLDPVCRAKIADNTAPTAAYQGKTYQFCSEADKAAFLANPAKYLSGR